MPEKKVLSKKIKALSFGVFLVGAIFFTQTQVLAVAVPGAMTVSTAKSTFSTTENVVIKWTAAKNATKYGLTVRKAPYDGDKNVVWDHYVTGTSKSIGKLPAGNYLVRMMPYNSAGSGSVSNTVYFTVAAPAVPLPGAMTVSVKSTFKTSENVTIKWTVSKNATKYGLSVWKSPYTGDPVWDNYVTGTSKNIGKLPAGSYRVNMKPYNSAGSGPNSNSVDFTVGNPSQPTPSPSGSSSGNTSSQKADITSASYQYPLNNYSHGQCTWYAWGRAREAAGRELPRQLGDAKDWYANAKKAGYTVNKKKPKANSIAVWIGTGKSEVAIETIDSRGPLGHVTYVESVSKNGKTMNMSEGNYNGTLYHEVTLSTKGSRNSGTWKQKLIGYIYLK